MDIKNIYKDKRKVREIFDSKEFSERYTTNLELGSIYSKEKTTFRIWTPVAKSVILELFTKTEEAFIKEEEIEMLENENGVWIVEKRGDLNNIYYKYKIEIGDKTNNVIDPISKAVSANGEYSMVIDLEKTNPEAWANDVKPKLENPTDAIIYEMHIRDFTIDENSGAKNKGKYKGVIETNTKTKNGFKTGIDHVKDLGVTHVHLLPTFDYKSVDEKNLNIPQYNWGYDPENYNCPEGSYSSNPFDGDVRIKEFKEMVQGLHKEGLRVVMDVVYNHTYETKDSLFNKVVPYYYYRENEDGSFSDASACGNETASERSMFRKFMVESIVYWAKEYHIDGFRFDLMGIHDIETMVEIRKELDKIDPTIIVYGEGWAGGDSPLEEEKRALKKNTIQYGKHQIAAFSDDIRDAIKGDVFIDKKVGFVNGGEDFEESIKCGIVASTNNEQVDYEKVIYSDSFWANEPYQTVTYASAHDNYTLWDKLTVSGEATSEAEKIKMNKLVAAMILTSQGISFIHAGEEFLRTKCDEKGNLIENSFKSSDLVNKLDWTRREKYNEVFEYYKGLIALRKNHKIFRLPTTNDINARLNFLDIKEKNAVAYTLNGQGIDEYKKVLVVFNGNEKSLELEVPEGTWYVVLNGKKIDENSNEAVISKRIKVEGRTALILVRK